VVLNSAKWTPKTARIASEAMTLVPEKKTSPMSGIFDSAR
jgi:hypothetical protein